MLKLNQVTRQFGKFTAVDHLELEISQGLIFGLLGPNGAGKTTLLRMIMGLIRPTFGNITLFNTYAPTDWEVREKIGYMPQQLAIYPGLSVLENILFFGRLYNSQDIKIKQRADEIIDMVELSGQRDNLVSSLSGGMVRRAMLATTLIHQPALIILDEPTAGVDPSLRLKFWQWFQTLADAGTSIIITTHHIAEADHCDRVVFLREGKILEQGPPNTLMKTYNAQDLEAAFVKAIETKGMNKEHSA
jgi:ABC-2 type transport system ATP-binding protein